MTTIEAFLLDKYLILEQLFRVTEPSVNIFLMADIVFGIEEAAHQPFEYARMFLPV